MNIKKVKIRIVGGEIFRRRALGGEAMPRSMKIKLFAAIALGILLMEVFAASTLAAPQNLINEGNIIKIAKEEPARDHMDVWLDRLVSYECDACGPDYRRLDVNGQYSYGCLQFQEATFRRYAKRYNIFTEERPYDSSSIYSCDIQKEVARAMWVEMGSSYEFGKNWYTSIYKRGLGLP